jgi:hypothetical protein
MCDCAVIRDEIQGVKESRSVFVIFRLLYVGQTFIGPVGQNPLVGDHDNGHFKQQVDSCFSETNAMTANKADTNKRVPCLRNKQTNKQTNKQIS